MQRLIAAILAIPTLANGLVMLLAGPAWYERVPGVTETGPFNPHFVKTSGSPPWSPGSRSGRGHGALAIGQRRLRAPVFWRRMPCSTF